MTISQKELQALLAEIELLKLENALLRKAAGICSPNDKQEEEVAVTNDEKMALLRKII